MKKSIKVLAITLCAATCVLAASCGNPAGKADILGEPKAATPLSWQDRLDNEGVELLRSKAESFAADFSPVAYSQFAEGSNFSVSPLSVYMALSLAAECAAGNTKTQLLNALGVTYEQLSSSYADYFRSVIAEYRTYENQLEGCVTLSNSIWIDNRYPTNAQCIESLADNFYCYSYAADFYGDNKNANKAISNFVKEQTKGLINQDFDLSEDTVFALINTLYLKDIWESGGWELNFTQQNVNFTQGDGTVKNLKLLESNYVFGRVHTAESFKTFYAQTLNGHKLQFIVPQDGYSVEDVFTAENIRYINSITDYRGRNEMEKKEYYTRCIFPEFNAACDAELMDVLKEEFGLIDMFNPDVANFTNLSASPAYCSSVCHVTKLEVNKKGVEGAAVTIILGGNACAPEFEYEKVYEDFNVDRAFAFILSDKYGNTLFSGAVNKVGA